MRRSIRAYWRHIVTSFLIVIGISVMTIGLIALSDYIRTTQFGQAVPTSETVTSDALVSEKRPTIDESYTVPVDQPRVVSIPSIESTSYVQRVGVTSENVMAAPSNIFFTGWYIHSVSPGESGVSIMNGHAGGRYEQGIFRRLKELSEGDVITIQMGDLAWREFRVQSVHTYNVEDAAVPLYADDPLIDKELHLITCDGVFDDTMQTYDRRTIIVARGE